MSKLRTCPFCDGEVQVVNVSYKHEQWFVTCDNDRCLAKPFTTEFDSPQKAINAWNTRSERSCRILKTWSDSDFVQDWNYKCSECGAFVPVYERDIATGDVSSAANYCPNCGAKVVEQ